MSDKSDSALASAGSASAAWAATAAALTTEAWFADGLVDDAVPPAEPAPTPLATGSVGRRAGAQGRRTASGRSEPLGLSPRPAERLEAPPVSAERRAAERASAGAAAPTGRVSRRRAELDLERVMGPGAGLDGEDAPLPRPARHSQGVREISLGARSAPVEPLGEGFPRAGATEADAGPAPLAAAAAAAAGSAAVPPPLGQVTRGLRRRDLYPPSRAHASQSGAPEAAPRPALSRPVTGAGPALSRPVTGVGPALSRPVADVSPAAQRPVTGAGPALSRPVTGASPAATRPVADVSPAAQRPVTG
ncbi:MAG: hypothetical protein LBD97_10945, partial [Bifidobacteriaceae bacterium]|nr:hypothetical protein [Bifidobacteriaceae bacterium]